MLGWLGNGSYYLYLGNLRECDNWRSVKWLSQNDAAPKNRFLLNNVMGAAWHRVSVCASLPAALGSNPGSAEIFSLDDLSLITA